MLGEVVCPIGGTRAPENVELALVPAIPKPIEMHVNSFGVFLFDSVIGNPAGSVVVGLEQGSWLWMTKFCQGSADGAKGLGIEE